jgi:hypothetical protein
LLRTKTRHPEVLARRASLEGWTAMLGQHPGRRPSRLADVVGSHLRVTGMDL